MKCECIKSEHIIYQDEKVLAYLPENAFTLGHIVVAPIEHYQIIEVVPDDVLAHCYMIANAFSAKLFEKLNIQGTNILINNGLPDQELAHFTINVIPRVEGDTVKLDWELKQGNPEEINDAALFITDAMNEKPKKEPIVLDKKEEVPEILPKMTRLP